MVSGKARVAGVIGWPVTHSLSPRLHGWWLAQYRIAGAYIPLPVAPDRLGDAVKGLSALGFRGANVTVPHKESVCGLMSALDDSARRLGAVNTVVIDPDGRCVGRNTDGFGFLENLRTAGGDGDVGAVDRLIASRPTVVLGAGGAARAVVAALTDHGAPLIRVANRTVERTAALIRDLGGPVEAIDWPPGAEVLAEVGLLVNTTSLGMTGQPPLPVALDRLAGDAVVTDLVYAPLETELLKAARQRGNPVVDGLGMLLHQARPGFRAWFGVEPEVTPALRAAVLGHQANDSR